MSSLSEEAREYYRQLRSEFLLERAELDNIRETGKDQLTGLVPSAIVKLGWLIEHGDTHNIQLSAAKFVVEKGLLGENTPENELERLLRSIHKTPTTTT